MYKVNWIVLKEKVEAAGRDFLSIARIDSSAVWHRGHGARNPAADARAVALRRRPPCLIKVPLCSLGTDPRMEVEELAGPIRKVHVGARCRLASDRISPTMGRMGFFAAKIAKI